MKIHLNGALTEMEGPLTVAELLGFHKLKPETVVVEHNRIVPPKNAYATLQIQDGDRIEIVKFMGGG